MEFSKVLKVDNVLLTRRGHHLRGSLVLSRFHMVFSFPANEGQKAREIWICYPVIERVKKSRGCSWGSGSAQSLGRSSQNGQSARDNGSFHGQVHGQTDSQTHGQNLAHTHGQADDQAKQASINQPLPGYSDKSSSVHSKLSDTKAVPLDARPNGELAGFDRYLTSNIRVMCKDFTYYLLDFVNDSICTDVYVNLSKLATAAKFKGSIGEFYAFEYKPNALELKLDGAGWCIYDAEREYRRQGLLQEGSNCPWRLTGLNLGYRFCPSYPQTFMVPAAISDSVLQHAGKFRSKQRVPAIVYRHRLGPNGNIIARCLQPLVGLNIQNRSMQDERLVEEIFRSQTLAVLQTEQPQRNLIMDLRPITNAMAQHALGAGTENVDYYRGKHEVDDDTRSGPSRVQLVVKVFCNIDNIHVMRDSLNKLSLILNDLDRNPTELSQTLQHSLTKTQWLHRLSIILQSVDRICKSVHLNNTNVLIHCSDGWDRTSQISALAQLCLDPYFRTMRGFMVLVEKEWLSFGFKFAMRGDHGGCIGAILSSSPPESKQDTEGADSEIQSSLQSLSVNLSSGSTKTAVTSFFQRAANHIKNTASNLESSEGSAVYSGSNERSPIFHQFLDCVYQICRQHPEKFEFNSRFLKRLFYHSYSCQYGTFLCNSEKSLKIDEELSKSTVSVWEYFLSRPAEFINETFNADADADVVFFNYSDVKWWYELYGRTDSEMNGLSNSLDRKYSQLRQAVSAEKNPLNGL